MGLDRFDYENDEFIHYFQKSNQEDLINLQVESIYEDNNKRLWIGTNKGLIVFTGETNEYEIMGIGDVLPDDPIIGIIDDNEGNIWFTTEYSLFKLSPETGSINSYGIDHGLRSNIYYNNAITKNEEGLIFIGTTNGLLSFDPQDMIASSVIPPVIIKDFSLVNGNQLSFDKPLEEISEITLEYANNSFIIDFVALDYTSQHDDIYAYFLEGVDSDWQYCGPNDNFAKYTNINSGEYIFKVQASNKDNIWNQEGASIKITILPPFWQQWWFILLMTVLVVSAVIIVIMLRTRRLQLQVVNLRKKLKKERGSWSTNPINWKMPANNSKNPTWHWKSS
jgi:hypothetical protein